MNKKQFQELLIPLSEKEKTYKLHPEVSQKVYSDWSFVRKDSDGIYLFGTIAKDTGPDHCNIFAETPNFTPYNDIIFNKSEYRFSQSL